MTYTDAELVFIEESPPGLFPDNQDSNFGLVRQILTNDVQTLIDQLDEIYNERFVDTSTDYLDEWEFQMGLPQNVSGASTSTRRQLILSRLVKGPFTRTRRQDTVEKYLEATFGAAIKLVPSGTPIGSGLTLYAGTADVKTLYRVVQDVPSFSYEVRILDSATPDIVALTRELTRITPAGISFSVVQVADPFADTLTLSGNEITDAIRTAGTEGDGAATPGGIGIWDGTTNLCQNGGGETNTTGWAAQGTSTLGRDTGNSKFGSACLTSTATDTTYIGMYYNVAVSAPTVGDSYVFSGWVMCDPTMVGKNVHFAIEMVGGANPTGVTNITVALTQVWTYYEIVATVDYTDRTTVRGYVYNSSAPVVGGILYLDGAQIEKQVAATPYVETDGATASRSIASVQANPALITADQGWIALRVKLGFDSTQLWTPHSPGFVWINDGAHYISFYLQGTTGNWASGDSAGGSTLVISDSFSAGDERTIILKWSTAEGLRGISVDGSPFTTTALVALSKLTHFNLGSWQVGTWAANSTILWVACGKDTIPSDADAAAYAALGNSPTSADFASPSGFWPCVDDSFENYVSD